MMRVAYLLSLVLATPVILIGSMFKLLHWPGANMLLGIGQIVALIFFVIGFKYLSKNSTINVTLKIFWIVGLFVFPLIVGYVFYFKFIRPITVE